VILPSLVMALMWPGRIDAQVGAANVGGVVIDESGAALPGVTVTVTNKSNGTADGRRPRWDRFPQPEWQIRLWLTPKTQPGSTTLISASFPTRGWR
jgi:hypothetical protein